MLVRNAVDYVVGKNEIVDGKCEGETATLYGCDPLRCVESRCDNHVSCMAPTSCEYDKLCELLEGIEGIDIDAIAAFDGSIAPLGKCTPDGLPILVCKLTDPETGEVTFQNHAPTGPNGTLEPYAGECIECNKQYNQVDLWVADPESEFCGYRVYECDGEKFVFNPITCEYEKLPQMIKVSTTNAGNLEKVCETLDIPITITEPLTGTAADLIDLAIAEGLAFPTYGAPVAEDVVAITGQSTGPVIYAGQTGDCIEDTEGVSASTEFEFAADCLPVNLNVCLRKCLSAAEVKALGE